MKKILGALALCGGLTVFSSCENIPPDAYSLASDSLPAHAQSISQAQYADLQKSSRFYSITGQSIGEQRQAAAQEEADNDRFLEQFSKAHPEAGSIVPSEPREPGIVFNPDGTYSHVVKLNDGRTLRVETLGKRWIKSELRHAIEEFPSRRNQSIFYRTLYESLSAHDRQGLPDPVTLENDERSYPAERIRTINDELSAKLARSPQATPDWSALALGAPACAAEEGAGSGSDRSGNNYANPACAAQDSGIYAHYGWPSKPYLTCVKDQGRRGTCVSFAIASALESQISQAQSRFVNLSEQFIYQQGKLYGIRDDFDDGLNEALVLGAMIDQKWRIPFETAWEYNPSPKRKTNNSARLYTHSCDGYPGSCSDSSHQMQVYCSDSGKYRYCGFLAEAQPDQGFGLTSSSQLWSAVDQGGSLNRVLASLAVGRPVVWGFSVTPSWDHVSSDGFITFNGSGESNRGGHAVHAVGYIDNATLASILPSAHPGSGGGYMIVKNSWTNCFGDGGYLYVPYDYVRAYTGSAVVVSLNQP